MKPIIVFIITFLNFAIGLFACECPEYSLEKLDKESYEWADIIVIGKITKLGDQYKILVSENIKGNSNNEITGLTQGENEVFVCTWYPHRKGEYLLYLKSIELNGKTYYYTSQCLGSRLLSFELFPISLNTNKTVAELKLETNNWIAYLRKK